MTSLRYLDAKFHHPSNNSSDFPPEQGIYGMAEQRIIDRAINEWQTIVGLYQDRKTAH